MAIFPDVSALLCGLTACSSLGTVGMGHGMHVFIIKPGFPEGEMINGITLIDMYLKFRILAETQDVLGYVDHGFGEYGLTLKR